MQLLEDYLSDLTIQMWSRMFNWEICRIEGNDFPNDPHLIAGYVELSGGWEGVVAVTCSVELALKISRLMFGKRSKGTQDEMVDALGEIANIVGGNLKSYIAECGYGDRYSLSTPQFSETLCELPWCGKTKHNFRIGFESKGKFFGIIVSIEQSQNQQKAIEEIVSE